MVDHFAERRRSITLSGARTEAQHRVLGSLNLTIDGALWGSRPQNLANTILPYRWLTHGDKLLDEDHASNRKAYMKHLEENVNLPSGYSWFDAQPTRTLLNVQIKLSGRESGYHLKGTTDVVVAKSEHVTNDAVRSHVSVQLELKKSSNGGSHEPQVCLEHLAASMLNPAESVVTCLTDLNEMWTFYWFGLCNDSSTGTGVAIRKLVLTAQAAHAKYLLESFAEDGDSNRAGTLPETFVDRLSWKYVSEKLTIASDGAHTTYDDAGGSGGVAGQAKFDGDKRGREDDTGHSPDGRSEQQKRPKTGPLGDDLSASLRLLCPLGDVANELDLLDMMDENDRIRTVRELLAKYVVPRITGIDLSTDDTEARDTPTFLSSENLAQHDRTAQKLR